MFTFEENATSRMSLSAFSPEGVPYNSFSRLQQMIRADAVQLPFQTLTRIQSDAQHGYITEAEKDALIQSFEDVHLKRVVDDINENGMKFITSIAVSIRMLAEKGFIRPESIQKVEEYFRAKIFNLTVSAIKEKGEKYPISVEKSIFIAAQAGVLTEADKNDLLAYLEKVKTGQSDDIPALLPEPNIVFSIPPVNLIEDRQSQQLQQLEAIQEPDPLGHFSLTRNRHQEEQPDLVEITRKIQTLKSEMDRFMNVFSDSQDKPEFSSNSTLYYARAKSLIKELWQVIESVDFSTLNQVLPDRGEYLTALHNIICTSLDSREIKSLNQQEIDDFVESWALTHKVLFNKDFQKGEAKQSGYYNFGVSEISEYESWVQLRTKIMKNFDHRLNEKEEQEVQAAEDKTFKVHIQVPPEKRFPIMKAIMEAKHADWLRQEKFRVEEPQLWEERYLTLEEKKARGMQLESFSAWKMLPPSDDDGYFSAFVIYIEGKSKEEAVKKLQSTVEELYDLFQENGIQLNDVTPPRYSTPVIRNGSQKVPGMFYVQGDGDWKEYLFRQGKLDEVYDPSMNHGVRKGQEVQFNF